LDDQKLLSPKEALKLALKSQAQGIALTYNEPAIWLEYSLDLFKLAEKANLYTVWVTNGYATKENIDLIAPYLDVYRVDLKSFDNRFYQKLIKIPKAQAIFNTTKYLHQKYPQVHIECVTNIIPRWNDQPKNLQAIGEWILKNLGPKTPWHLTRFYPDAELNNISPTPEKTLFQARKKAMEQGLKFVYLGNLPVDKEDDTFCPKCGNLAIRRTGYKTAVIGVNHQGFCSDCQEDLNIKI
jgi:pyruvate formate lyase activating enzyme